MCLCECDFNSPGDNTKWLLLLFDVGALAGTCFHDKSPGVAISGFHVSHYMKQKQKIRYDVYNENKSTQLWGKIYYVSTSTTTLHRSADFEQNACFNPSC